LWGWRTGLNIHSHGASRWGFPPGKDEVRGACDAICLDLLGTNSPVCWCVELWLVSQSSKCKSFRILFRKVAASLSAYVQF
jgi:hypothetical protein